MRYNTYMHQELKKHLKEAVKMAYRVEIEDVHLEHPEKGVFGDYATNLPLVLTKKLKQPPMEIAKNLAYKMDELDPTFEYGGKTYPIFASIETASPGFINLKLSTEWLKSVPYVINQKGDNYGAGDFFKDKKVMVEYTDPNPFKMFHIGHVMTNAIGESLARIIEFSGAEVKRANYQGDVGAHVAKSLWGLMKKMAQEKETLESLTKLSLKERVYYLGSAYALGEKNFSEDEQAKKEIEDLNRVVYYLVRQKNARERGLEDKIVGSFDLDLIGDLYDKGRQWSLDYFETLYQRLGTKFDFYYFESVVGEEGYRIVVENVAKKIFEESEGAIVFKGEKYGLHTRVFVNSQGLPVYEAKDLGLAITKNADYAYDMSVIVTNREVNEYFKVVLQALKMINKDLAEKTTHIGHGTMKLKSGKMSSRTGDVISGDELLDRVKDKVLSKMSASEKTSVEESNRESTADKIAVASIKYNILKSGIGNDIVYDEETAIKLQGNTGPYLLYTHTRISSVLEKAGITETELSSSHYALEKTLHPLEEEILRHIYKFSEEVSLAAQRLSPNIIAGFAYDLAQKYNSLYAELPILKAENVDERNLRLYITSCTGQVLKTGLHLLGIQVVDKM